MWNASRKRISHLDCSRRTNIFLVIGSSLVIPPISRTQIIKIMSHLWLRSLTMRPAYFYFSFLAITQDFYLAFVSANISYIFLYPRVWLEGYFLYSLPWLFGIVAHVCTPYSRTTITELSKILFLIGYPLEKPTIVILNFILLFRIDLRDQTPFQSFDLLIFDSFSILQ